MAMPDMRIPLAEGLGEGKRLIMDVPRPDFVRLTSLTFEPVDTERFPCLALARAALEEGGAMPAILNAANEVAVEAFLRGELSFGVIATLVEAVCESLPGLAAPSGLDEALALEDRARAKAYACLQERFAR
jgi:1-deoxy-D-xylulose-5-phosphate reductoisomerase